MKCIGSEAEKLYVKDGVPHRGHMATIAFAVLCVGFPVLAQQVKAQAGSPNPLVIPTYTFTCAPNPAFIGEFFNCTMTVQGSSSDGWTLYLVGKNQVVGTANQSGASIEVNQTYTQTAGTLSFYGVTNTNGPYGNITSNQVQVTVEKASPTLSVSTSAGTTATSGTFTAVLTGSRSAIGTVSVSINGSTVGSATYVGMDSNGLDYSYTAPTENVGTYTVVFAFAGDAENNATSASAAYTVTSPDGLNIQSLSLPEGPVGMGFVVNGASFGSSQGSSTVNLNGAPLTVLQWSGSAITVQVPTGAATGAVIVTVNGQASNAVNFQVDPAFQCSLL